MSVILPNLVLGGLEEVMHEAETHALGVTHMLNVASEIAADRSNEYVYLHRGVSDDHPKNDITEIFDECIDFIDKGISDGGTVMINCWSGVSRSACVTMAYLVLKHELTAVDAFHKVLAKRPIVDPWPSYLGQFQTWADAIGRSKHM